MIELREPFEGDWTQIGRLADEAVSHIGAAPKQAAWLRSRKEFDGKRRHFVAELGTKIVGYGSVEASRLKAGQGYRLFLVVSWSRPSASEIADVPLARLRREAVAMHVDRVWMREYANDKPFVEYLLSRGFEAGGEYIQEEAGLVNLTCNEWARE